MQLTLDYRYCIICTHHIFFCSVYLDPQEQVLTPQKNNCTETRHSLRECSEGAGEQGVGRT